MKVNKYISLDEEIARNLMKEPNASLIVNEQLKQYYDVKGIKNLPILKGNLAKIKQELKQLRRKEKEIISEIDKIENQNKKFFEDLNKKLNPELIKQLQKIENLDYETSDALANKFDLYRRGIGGIKLMKIWEDLKGGQ